MIDLLLLNLDENRIRRLIGTSCIDGPVGPRAAAVLDMAGASDGLVQYLAACSCGTSRAVGGPGLTAGPGPGTTRRMHDINMQLDGTTYHYVPRMLRIRQGDVVVFRNVSGGPHNVQFWADSIPAGAAYALGAGMPDQMSMLAGPLIVEPNGVYTVTFEGVPPGVYRFYCLVHLAIRMTGAIVVEP